MPPLHADGTVDIEHGRGWLGRLIISLMTLPAAGLRQPVRLDVVEDGAELLWTQRIGQSILRTRQRASDSRLEERSGTCRCPGPLRIRVMAWTNYRNVVDRFGHIDAEFVKSTGLFSSDGAIAELVVRFYPWWEHPQYRSAVERGERWGFSSFEGGKREVTVRVGLIRFSGRLP
jgi:hypothetical protein